LRRVNSENLSKGELLIPKTKTFLRRNLGAVPLFAFIVLVLCSFAFLGSGAIESANATETYASYALGIGVVLELISLLGQRQNGSEDFSMVAPEALPPPWARWSRNRKLAATSAAVIVLLSIGVAVTTLPAVPALVTRPFNPPLKASVAYVNSIKEPGGTVVLSLGMSTSGGSLPYEFVATWSDGTMQSNSLGTFARTLANQSIPTSASVEITSADGQSVTVTTQIPAPS
jgi:hypothetical protein